MHKMKQEKHKCTRVCTYWQVFCEF